MENFSCKSKTTAISTIQILLFTLEFPGLLRKNPAYPHSCEYPVCITIRHPAVSGPVNIRYRKRELCTPTQSPSGSWISWSPFFPFHVHVSHGVINKKRTSFTGAVEKFRSGTVCCGFMLTLVSDPFSVLKCPNFRPLK